MSDYPQVSYEPVGKHLAALRRKRGLTLREVSEVLGHASTEKILSFERGKAVPSLKKIKVLTELYHGNVEDLFGVILMYKKLAQPPPPTQ